MEDAPRRLQYGESSGRKLFWPLSRRYLIFDNWLYGDGKGNFCEADGLAENGMFSG